MKLVGLDGNAYVIMGTWRSNAQRQGRSKEAIKMVLDDAMSGDYNHLLQVMTKYTTE